MSVWGVRARTAQKRQGMRVVFIQVSTSCYGSVCVCMCIHVYFCVWVCVCVCMRYAIHTNRASKTGLKSRFDCENLPKKFVKQLIFMFLCFWSCLHARNRKFINKCCCCCCCYTPFLAASCNTVATAHTLKNIESLLLIIIVAPTTVYLQSLNCFSYTHIRIVFLYLFLVYFEWKSIWITI